MSRFIVAIFPDLASAQEGIRTLKGLASERVIQLHGAATVTKAEGGKLTMKVTAHDGPAVVAAGAMIGGLAGLAIGPLATAILAAGGAVFGVSAGLTNRGAGMSFARKVTQDLSPGLAAVVADVTTEDVALLVTDLEGVGGTVTRQETVPEQ